MKGKIQRICDDKVNLYSSLNRDFIPQIRSSWKDLTVNPIFISLEKVSFWNIENNKIGLASVVKNFDLDLKFILASSNIYSLLELNSKPVLVEIKWSSPQNLGTPPYWSLFRTSSNPSWGLRAALERTLTTEIQSSLLLPHESDRFLEKLIQ